MWSSSGSAGQGGQRGRESRGSRGSRGQRGRPQTSGTVFPHQARGEHSSQFLSELSTSVWVEPDNPTGASLQGPVQMMSSVLAQPAGASSLQGPVGSASGVVQGAMPTPAPSGKRKAVEEDESAVLERLSKAEIIRDYVAERESNRSLKKTIKSLKNQLRSKDNAYEGVRHDETALKVQLENALEENFRQEEACERHCEELAAIHTKWVNTNIRLVDASEEVAGLKKQLAAARQQGQQPLAAPATPASESELQARVQHLCARLAHSEKDLLESRKNASSLLAEKKEMRAGAQARILSLENEIASRPSMDEHNTIMAGAQARILSLENEIAGRPSLDELNTLMAEVRRLEESLGTLSAQKQGFEQRISHQDEKTRQCLEKIHNLEEVKKQLTEENARLGSELEAYKELASASTANNDGSMQVMAQLEIANQEKKKLFEENRKLSSDLKAHTEKLEQSVQEKEMVSEENRQLSSDLKANIKRLGQSVQEKETLSATNANLLSDLKAQAEELEQLMQEKDAIFVENSRMQSTIQDHIHRAIIDKATELERVTKSLKDLQEEKHKLAHQNSQLSSNLATQEDLSRGLAAKVEMLTEDLKSRTESASTIAVGHGELAKAKEELGKVKDENDQLLKENAQLNANLTAERDKANQLLVEVKQLEADLSSANEGWRNSELDMARDIAAKEKECQRALDDLSHERAESAAMETNLRSNLESEKKGLENDLNALLEDIKDKDQRIAKMEKARDDAVQQMTECRMTIKELRRQISHIEDTLVEKSALLKTALGEAEELRKDIAQYQSELAQEKSYVDDMKSQPSNSFSEADAKSKRKVVEELRNMNVAVEESLRFIDTIQPLDTLLDDEEEADEGSAEEDNEEDNEEDEEGLAIAPDETQGLSSQPPEDLDISENESRPATPVGNKSNFEERGTSMDTDPHICEEWVTDIDTVRHFLKKGGENAGAIFDSHADAVLFLKEFAHIDTNDATAFTGEVMTTFTEFVHRQPSLLLTLADLSNAVGRARAPERVVYVKDTETQTIIEEVVVEKGGSEMENNQSVWTDELVKEEVKEDKVEAEDQVTTDDQAKVEDAIPAVATTTSRFGQVCSSLWNKPLWQWLFVWAIAFFSAVIIGGNSAGNVLFLLLTLLILVRTVVTPSAVPTVSQRGTFISTVRPRPWWSIVLRGIFSITWVFFVMWPLVFSIYSANSTTLGQSRTALNEPFFPQLLDTYEWGYALSPVLNEVSELAVLIVGDVYPPLY